METKHTPGSWKIRPNSVGGFGFYIETVDQSHDKTFIGDVGGGLHTQPEIEANAKLIAAAPDMLNALIEVKAHLVRAGYRTGGRIGKIIDEAIKKATT